MIVEVILGVVTPLILLVVAGYLIRTHSEDKVLEWVKIAVRAAEQIYNAPGQGKAKFDYVATWISERFAISKEDLKNLIESAVYELNKAHTDSGQKE